VITLRLFSLCVFAVLLCRLSAEPKEEAVRSYAVTDERMAQALVRVAEYGVGKSFGDGEILVLGQVNKPGFYKPETLRLGEAVAVAGGPTRLASLTHFYILRAGALTEYFAARKKPPLKTIFLQSGDTLFIEYQCTGFGASALLESSKPK
jgi:hypothetical protein